jgi:hypothetical protein
MVTFSYQKVGLGFIVTAGIVAGKSNSNAVKRVANEISGGRMVPHPSRFSLSSTDPQNLRRLPPVDPFRHRSQNYFLYLHRPLHFAFAVEAHLLSSMKLYHLAPQSGHFICYFRRAYYVLMTKVEKALDS